MTTPLHLTAACIDLLFLTSFAAAALIPFAIYTLLWLLGMESLPPPKEEGAGRRLLGPLVIGFYYWFLRPFLRLSRLTGLSPNCFTLASLLASIPTAIAIATGHFALASVLLVAGTTLDVVDGNLARSKGLASKAGAFLDSTADRISDGLILGGFAVYYAGTPTMLAALLALIMSFATSYSRARGESLGVAGSQGLMQRADRLVVLALALALSPFFAHRTEGFIPHPSYAVAEAALWLLAAFSTFTATSRMFWILKRLQPEDRVAMKSARSPISFPPPLLSPVAAPTRAPVGARAGESAGPSANACYRH